MTAKREEVMLLQEPSISTTTQNILKKAAHYPLSLSALVEMEVTTLGVSFDIVLTLDPFSFTAWNAFHIDAILG